MIVSAVYLHRFTFHYPFPRLTALSTDTLLGCPCQDARLDQLLRVGGKVGILVRLGGYLPDGAFIAAPSDRLLRSII